MTDPKSPAGGKGVRWLAWTSKYLIAYVLIVVMSYVIWFGLMNSGGYSQNPDAWGQFGDFIGGLLNPLIALLALAWLKHGVEVQKEELGYTRIALDDAAKAQQKQVRISALTAILQVELQKISELDRQLNEDNNRIFDAQAVVDEEATQLVRNAYHSEKRHLYPKAIDKLDELKREKDKRVLERDALLGAQQSLTNELKDLAVEQPEKSPS